MAKKTGYSTEDIKNIDNIDHIRLRTRVYLGQDVRDTAAREITDNAFDEIVKGYGTRVDVEINTDGSITVTDDGRGLPVDMKDGVNGIVLTLGTAMSGSNFEDTTTAAGTNGIGASATNAISSRMDVTVWRDSKEYNQSFREGRPGVYKGKDFDPSAEFTPKEGMKLVGKKSSHKDGTRVRFIFDETILPDDELHIDDFVMRINATARLIDKAKLSIVNHNTGEKTDFNGPWGVESVMDYMSGGKAKEPAVISGSATFINGGSESTVDYDIAFASNSDNNEVFAFTNGVFNPDGGSHANSAVKIIGSVLEERGSRLRSLGLKKGESSPKADDYMARSTVVVSVRSSGVSFVGQDKRAIRAIALGNALRNDSETKLKKWANSKASTDMVTAWAKEALTRAREVAGAELARERAKLESSSKRMGENMSMPEALVPCRQTGRGTGATLFIVEGKSAMSTVRSARDSKTQAIYPIRGKILNTYGMAQSKAMKNKEISDIIKIIGAGIGDNCDPSKSRYDMIVFLSDADPDGMNIQSLLTIMAKELLEPMVKEGMFFYANPPLFVVSKGREKIYCLDEGERDDAVKQLGTKGVNVTREKGLGESDADDLYDTVMNPDSRILTKPVQVESDFEYTFDDFFGKDLERRKEWIRYVSKTLSEEEVYDG